MLDNIMLSNSINFDNISMLHIGRDPLLPLINKVVDTTTIRKRRLTMDGCADDTIESTKCKKIKYQLRQKELKDIRSIPFKERKSDLIGNQSKTVAATNYGKLVERDKCEVDNSLVTRKPFRILSHIKKGKDKREESKLNRLLESLKEEIPEGSKIGAAVKKEDCFFDSIAQGLNALKGKGQIDNDSQFNVKSLRKLCKTYAKLVYQSKSSWLDIVLQRAGYKICEYIEGVTITAADENPNAKNLIRGSLEVEGKIICEIYGVKIITITLKDELDGVYLSKNKIGRGKNVIHLLEYRNHVVPILSNITNDINEMKKVLRVEVYGKLCRKRKISLPAPDNNAPKRMNIEASFGNNNIQIPDGKKDKMKKEASITNENKKVSKTINMGTSVNVNNNTKIPNCIQDKLRPEVMNTQEFRPIPHQLLELMYKLDLLTLCSFRKLVHKQKYPSLSLAFKKSKIPNFNDISLFLDGKTIHVQVDNVDKYYFGNNLNYSKLFAIEKKSCLINNYFNSFVKHLLNESRKSVKDIKFLVVYTNASLDFAADHTLKKRRFRNYFPFKFEVLKKCRILKDFLFTDDRVNGRGFYKFSKDRITREELLKRLELSSTMQKRLKISQNVIKEIFLEKLVFLVNQPNREELNGIIRSEMKKTVIVEDDYIALQEKLARDLAFSKKVKPLQIFELNLLTSFLHDMCLYKKIYSINMENHGIYNDVVINYRDKNKMSYIRAYYTMNCIRYSELFPSKSVEGKKKFSLNDCFALFVEKLQENRNIKNFIIFSNESFVLTEKRELKRDRSKNYFPLKMDSLDIQSKDYEFLKFHSYLNIKGLYRFARRDTPRLFRLLSLRSCFYSRQKDEQFLKKGETLLKKQFLNALIFAVNQPIMKSVACMDLSEIPYSCEELNEITLRWLESHDFGSITNNVVEMLLEDIKKNRSSDRSTRKKIDEEFKFAISVCGRKVTPAFLQFLDFLIKGDGKRYLELIRIEGISFTNVSTILRSAGKAAVTAFSDLFELWFDKNGEKTRYLKTLQKENIRLLYMSNILSRSGENASTVFKALYDVWFDENGNKTHYLKRLDETGIRLNTVSSMLCRAGINAVPAFESLYDLWFDKKGNMTKYLKTLRDEGISFKNISAILHQSGAKASLAFKSLYKLWFDKGGNKTKYLKTLMDEGMELNNISSILSRTATNATTAFKDLYELWFDDHGNQTHYLKILKENGISLRNISSILYRTGRNVAKAFKDLFNELFDQDGNKTKYLQTFMEAGISLKNISNILAHVGTQAATAFKELYNLWFDGNGKRTQYLKTLTDEGISLGSMSSILRPSGSKVASAFKSLYDLWFDEEGNQTKYLKNLQAHGISLAIMNSILLRAGFKAAEAFKSLYDLWFDEIGNTTKYIQILKEEGVDLANMASILKYSGRNAATSFQNLYNLWFDEDGNKTRYLRTLNREEINLTNVCNILSPSGASAAKSFKNLYDVWFDAMGNKSPYLKVLAKEGVHLTSVFHILKQSGSNAGEAFKNLYNLWFDKNGNKTKYLKLFENEGIDVTILSRIFYRSGTNAAIAFKNLYDLWFDDEGNKTVYLKNLERDGTSLIAISKSLYGTANNAPKEFKKLLIT